MDIFDTTDHDTDAETVPETDPDSGPRAAGEPPLDIESETEETVHAARRDVLKAVGGASVGMGLTRRLDEYLEGAEDTRPRDDPHTVATFQALVDLVVPETPNVAEELGEEHRAGGLNVDLETVTIDFLDSVITIAIPPANEDTGAPLSEALANLMDAGADALIAQNGTTSPPAPTRFPGGGSFASLSRTDRRRALAQLERRDDLVIIVTVLVVAPMLLYYSERTGYADFGAPPGERGFTGTVQSWEQTGYTGPAKGYPALRGYEVQEFEDKYEVENDDRPARPAARTPADDATETVDDGSSDEAPTRSNTGAASDGGVSR